jgi:hypothetical protein
MSVVKKYNHLIYFTKQGAEEDAAMYRSKGYLKARVKKLPEPTKLFGFKYEILF